MALSTHSFPNSQCSTGQSACSLPGGRPLVARDFSPWNLCLLLPTARRADDACDASTSLKSPALLRPAA